MAGDSSKPRVPTPRVWELANYHRLKRWRRQHDRELTQLWREWFSTAFAEYDEFVRFAAAHSTSFNTASV